MSYRDPRVTYKEGHRKVYQVVDNATSEIIRETRTYTAAENELARQRFELGRDARIKEVWRSR